MRRDTRIKQLEEKVFKLSQELAETKPNIVSLYTREQFLKVFAINLDRLRLQVAEMEHMIMMLGANPDTVVAVFVQKRKYYGGHGEEDSKI